MPDDLMFDYASIDNLGDITPTYDPDIEVTPEQEARAASAVLDNRYGLASKVTAFTVGGVLGLPDQISASAGFTRAGQINETMLSAIGSPGLTQFYYGNKGAIEAGSGIASVIAADLAARRFTAPAGVAMRFLSRVPYASKIAALDREYIVARKVAEAAQSAAARTGLMGVEQYTGQLTFARLGRPGFTASVSQAKNAFIGTAIRKGLAHNVTTEAILVAGANSNSFLFSNDMSENMLMLGGGLVLGAAVDRLMAVNTLKKFANGDLSNRLFAKAYDPFGTEASRMKAATFEIQAGMKTNPTVGALQGHWFDLATSYQISASELRNTEVVPKGNLNPLAQKRGRLATQQDEEINNIMTKATSAGIQGVPGSHFAMSMEGYGNSISYTLHRDATAMWGLEEVGAARGEFTLTGISQERGQLLTARVNEIQSVLEAGGKTVMSKGKPVFKKLSDKESKALQDELLQANWRLGLTELHLIDGEWVPPEIGRLFDDMPDYKIRRDRLDDESRFWSLDGRRAGDQIGLDAELTLFLPDGKTLNTLGLVDTIGLYKIGNELIKSFLQTGEVMSVPVKANWFQLDMAEELIKRSGGDESVVRFPKGMSRDSARVSSFRQKVHAIGKQFDDPDAVEAMRARYKFNMPRLTSFEAGLMGTEAHPIEMLTRGLQLQDLKDMTYNDLVQGIQMARQVNGMSAMAKDRSDGTLGNMFRFMEDDAGRQMKPIIGFKRPMQQFEWIKDNLTDRLMLHKLHVRTKLTDAKAGKMTATLTDNLLNNPDFVVASQVTGLQDAQVMSFLPGFGGAAPQSGRGGLLYDVASREWRDRDTPALLASARLRDNMERQTRSIMKERIQLALGDTLNVIKGPRNGGSKLLVDQFLSYRSGWDLKTKQVQGLPVATTVDGVLPDGRTVKMFLLDHESVSNQRNYRNMFGRELKEGDVLLSPTGTKVGLDPMADDFLTRAQALFININQEKNTLNRAMGLGEIGAVAMYAPPPSTRGKLIGFVLDTNNRPVRGGVIVADTAEEYARQRAWLENPENTESPLLRPGHRLMGQDEIQDFNSVWDEAQMHWLDPGTTAAQPGRKSAGALTRAQVNPNALDEMLEYIMDSYLKHGHDILTTVMKDQLIAARTRAAIAGEAKVISRKMGTTEGRSVYDFYVQNLMGQAAIRTPGSFVGQIQNSTEAWVNSFIRDASPKARGSKAFVNRVFRGAWDYVVNHQPWDQSDGAMASFRALRDELGEYMPYQTVTKLMDSQQQIKPPKEFAEIMGNMSKFEATMRLRMFEVIHPLMNLSGIINAMPSVIRHMQPMLGESAADHATRVGRIADIFNLSDKRIGVFSMPKLIYKTFKNTWDRSRHADWDYMVSHGFVTQEVAEFQRQFGAIKDRRGLDAFLFGSEHSSGISKKGLVNWISILSDRSEDFSRSWGHMVGLELADTLGVAGREARHSFAHDVANKMIANYDPKNRPAMFQGPLGAPIGLFQSFIWNYYQRMFRYIETGDMRSLATQYATQSALFGVTTVPGWNQINKLFFDNSDGDNNPADQIWERFGTAGGDFLFGGIMSNIPKLVNLLPGNQNMDAVDLYSRGDTNVRLPGFTPPPMFDTIGRVYQALSQGAGMWADGNPGNSPTQVAEIMSNMLTNRPMSGWIEQLAGGGYDTDSFGQVISEARDAMEITARALGIRSLRMSKELDAFYTNQNARAHERSQRAALNRSARAAIRAGRVDDLPGLYEGYVRSGGDPRRFSSWIKDNATVALQSRGERMLDDFEKNPNKAQLMRRLLDMGVKVGEDESTDIFTDPTYDATMPDPMLDSGPSVTPLENGYME